MLEGQCWKKRLPAHSWVGVRTPLPHLRESLVQPAALPWSLCILLAVVCQWPFHTLSTWKLEPAWPSCSSDLLPGQPQLFPSLYAVARGPEGHSQGSCSFCVSPSPCLSLPSPSVAVHLGKTSVLNMPMPPASVPTCTLEGDLLPAQGGTPAPPAKPVNFSICRR